MDRRNPVQEILLKGQELSRVQNRGSQGPRVCSLEEEYLNRFLCLSNLIHTFACMHAYMHAYVINLTLF